MNEATLTNIRKEGATIEGAWAGEQADAVEAIREICQYKTKHGVSIDASISIDLFGASGKAASDNTFEGSFIAFLSPEKASRVPSL